MLSRMRVTFELNDHEMAHLLWDGLNELYSETDFTMTINRHRSITRAQVRACIAEALRRRGQESVNCGAIFDHTDRDIEWCRRQVILAMGS